MSDDFTTTTGSAAPHEPDPTTFDINEWLTPVTQKNHRRVEEVTVIRDFSLVPEIKELNALQVKLEKQQARRDRNPDASVAESVNPRHLEQRMQELSEKIRGASITLKVRAMNQDEIDQVIGDTNPKDPMYWPLLFAECVIFPNGETLPAQQWPEFRNTIGDAQMGDLIDAFKTASFQKIQVNAVF